MRFLLLLLLPIAAHAADASYDCEGKRSFFHRGAPSTVPVDEKRSYRVEGDKFEGLECKVSDAEVGCHGLTPEMAYRRILIDRKAGTVRDALELPTANMVFEGRCK